MTVKSLWDSFTGFLNHHASDLQTIASSLSTIVGALPIDAQDKTLVNDGITSLNEAATAIQEWLAGAPANVGDVVVKESDIETAVANVLERLGYKQQPSAEGNASA